MRFDVATTLAFVGAFTVECATITAVVLTLSRTSMSVPVRFVFVSAPFTDSGTSPRPIYSRSDHVK